MLEQHQAGLLGHTLKVRPQTPGLFSHIRLLNPSWPDELIRRLAIGVRGGAQPSHQQLTTIQQQQTNRALGHQ